MREPYKRKFRVKIELIPQEDMIKSRDRDMNYRVYFTICSMKKMIKITSQHKNVNSWWIIRNLYSRYVRSGFKKTKFNLTLTQLKMMGTNASDSHIFECLQELEDENLIIFE